MRRVRTWQPVADEDGNPNLPTTERAVLVFLCGHLDIADGSRPSDAGWGLRLGYYDHDKRYWRVGGVPEKYVTHWMDEPAPPK